MTITHIEIVSIPVADQDAAKAFYVDVLGCELISDLALSDGMRWVQVGPRGSQAAFSLVTWFDNMKAGNTQGLVLATDDIEADYATLTERGVTFKGGIDDQPWGRFASFTDPDGNGLILREELPEAPQVDSADTELA